MEINFKYKLCKYENFNFEDRNNLINETIRYDKVQGSYYDAECRINPIFMSTKITQSVSVGKKIV